MLPPQQGADDNSRPLPAQGGARSNAGDGFVLLLAVEDQALQSPLPRSAADCPCRIFGNSGLLAADLLDQPGFSGFGRRPPRFKTIPAASNAPRFESCFKAPELTVDCRIVIQWSDPGKAPAGPPNLQTAQQLDLPYQQRGAQDAFLFRGWYVKQRPFPVL